MADFNRTPEGETDGTFKHKTLENEERGEADFFDDDTILDILLESSMANHQPGKYETRWNKETGRVISLSLGTTLYSLFHHHWDLSPMVRHLDALESLTLSSCKTLPEELVQLRSLRNLTLIGCSSLETFPLCLNHMHQLQELRIGFIRMFPPVFLSQISSLPNLQVLQFPLNSLSEQEELSYLRELLSPSLQFSSSLRELILNDCHIGNKGFRFLLTRVVPNFPHLKCLSLCKNNISSLQGILPSPMNLNIRSRVGDTDDPEILTGHFRLLKLEELILSENPILSTPEGTGKNTKELNILVEFLSEHAPRLGYLGHNLERSNLWSAQIQHLLDVNMCGRCLMGDATLQFQNHDRQARHDLADLERDGVIARSIPIATWAIVLSRVNMVFAKMEQTGDDQDVRETSFAERRASTIYYFLRHGPALAGRTFAVP